MKMLTGQNGFLIFIQVATETNLTVLIKKVNCLDFLSSFCGDWSWGKRGDREIKEQLQLRR
jgi:hypothetical protein